MKDRWTDLVGSCKCYLRDVGGNNRKDPSDG